MRNRNTIIIRMIADKMKKIFEDLIAPLFNVPVADNPSTTENSSRNFTDFISGQRRRILSPTKKEAKRNILNDSTVYALLTGAAGTDRRQILIELLIERIFYHFRR